MNLKMKKYFAVLTTFFAICSVFLVCNVTLKAQDAATVQTAPTPLPNKEKPRNLLDLLNLAPEQIQQIRAIQRQNKIPMQDAQKNLREAQKALQDTIYADQTTSDLVEQKIREVAEAQRHVIEFRTRTEFRIRQVLNAEQLAKFKELREKFEQIRQANQAPDKSPLRPAKVNSDNFNRPLQMNRQNQAAPNPNAQKRN